MNGIFLPLQNIASKFVSMNKENAMRFAESNNITAIMSRALANPALKEKQIRELYLSDRIEINMESGLCPMILLQGLQKFRL